MKKSRLNPSTILATFFGIGFIPFMPGTFGSLAAFGIYLLLPQSLYFGSGHYILSGSVLIFALIAVFISRKAELILGEDAGSIVIDEVAGYFMATLFLPHNWLIGLYAFILFRVFDIAKPFPIYRSQAIPKGWGVVIDDLLAGLYANLLIQILIRIYPSFFGL
ncbi:MAG: phosphatidylglycerophosphatase A [Candidatus Cloacimonetes bacterium]|nr:phosphatidylglycerophosphatase A [Candidatus Cloacimonadota bacterium]MDD2682706.1 phosphatidylglycerophosphatase A [Candidatus Cloacimonadota bacterium]MDD4667448.1 phosphatidylglycerophosphatase A [Candidatus Cloacimonadota bacterium]